jgi:hypothetical protein
MNKEKTKWNGKEASKLVDELQCCNKLLKKAKREQWGIFFVALALFILLEISIFG